MKMNLTRARIKPLWLSIFLTVAIQFCLGQAHASMSLMAALDKPHPTMNIRVPRGIVTPEPTQPLSVAVVEGFVNVKLKHIENSKRVYSWDGSSPRDRIRYFCIEQCACLAQEIRPELIKYGLHPRLLTLRSGEDLKVTLKASNGRILSYENYHQVLVFFLANRWRVIDPLVIGSGKPELLTEWLNRIERPAKKVADLF